MAALCYSLAHSQDPSGLSNGAQQPATSAVARTAAECLGCRRFVGVDQLEDTQEVLAANEQDVQWHIAKRRKTIEKLADKWQKSMLQAQYAACVEQFVHGPG